MQRILGAIGIFASVLALNISCESQENRGAKEAAKEEVAESVARAKALDDHGLPIWVMDQPIHFDDQGLIVHIDDDGERDGGDTAQREGWYWLGVYLRESIPELEPWPHPRKPPVGKAKPLSFDEVIDILEPNDDGVFVRHPTDPEWNDPFDPKKGTSRDQIEPLVAAMGVWGKVQPLKRLWHRLPVSVLGKHSFNGEYRSKITDGVDPAKLDILGVLPECSEPPTANCNPKTNCSAPKVPECRTPRRCLPPDAGRVERCLRRCAGSRELDPRKRAECPKKCKDKHDDRLKEYASCLKAQKKEEVALVTCEAGRGARLLEAEAMRVQCELTRVRALAECELRGFLWQEACANTHGHTGDLLFPSTMNLFRRALNEAPGSATSILDLPPTPFPSVTWLRQKASWPAIGQIGEDELPGAVAARIYCGQKDATHTTDDLNLIAKLLMAKIRFPTPPSERAARDYAELRPHTYGSYFDAYLAEHGEDWDDIKKRMRHGIDHLGWKPTTQAHVGAVRWYHRPDQGS
jgi:hypothetical protein